MSDIFEICRGASPRPISKYLTEDENGVNWIKIGDTKNVEKYITKTKQKITKEGAKKSRFVKKGDFILSNSMSFGKPYIMNTEGYIHDGWLLLSPKDKNLNIDFLYNVLNSGFVYQLFKQSTIGGVVENLNIDIVKNVKIPLPPLEIQNQIVEKMDRALEIKKQKEKKVKDLLESIDDYVLNELGIEYEEVEEKKIFGVILKELGENKRFDPTYHLRNDNIIKTKYKIDVLKNYNIVKNDKV